MLSVILTAVPAALLLATTSSYHGSLPENAPAATAMAAPATDGARPIEGDDLRALFRDVFVALPLSPGVVTRQLGEAFRSNGDYERIAYWGRQQGTFSIEGDAVCIEGPGLARQCRRVTRLSDGTYSLVDVEDGTSTIVTISPLA